MGNRWGVYEKDVDHVDRAAPLRWKAPHSACGARGAFVAYSECEQLLTLL